MSFGFALTVVTKGPFWELNVENSERLGRDRCCSDSVLNYSDFSQAPRQKLKWADEEDEDATTAASSSCSEAIDHSDAEVEDLTSMEEEESCVCWVPVPAMWQPSTMPKQVAPSSQQTYRDQAPKQQERRTTIMLKNLPANASRESLMVMLNSQGLEGLYNFVYLPFDFATGSVLGYATLNLETSYVAELAMQLLQGFNGWQSEKPLEVSWNATHQGLEELRAFYRNSRSMHENVPDDYRPILLHEGKQAAFPAPTKTIQAPCVSRN